jgi:hypothetical protein
MPARRAAAKVVQQAQLKVPTHSINNQPHAFVSWLRQVAALNPVRSDEMLTENNIRCAWKDSLKALHLQGRVPEIDTRASKAEMQRLLTERENMRTAHASHVN